MAPLGLTVAVLAARPVGADGPLFLSVALVDLLVELYGFGDAILSAFFALGIVGD